MHAPTVPAAKSGYFGSGSDIPDNLFEHLNKNESLDASRKPHVPMEDQTESAMMFKQRTVETSASTWCIPIMWYANIAFLAFCRQLSFPYHAHEFGQGCVGHSTNPAKWLDIMAAEVHFSSPDSKTRWQGDKR